MFSAFPPPYPTLSYPTLPHRPLPPPFPTINPPEEDSRSSGQKMPMSRATPSGRQVQVQGTAAFPAGTHSSIAKLTASAGGWGGGGTCAVEVKQAAAGLPSGQDQCSQT